MKQFILTAVILLGMTACSQQEQNSLKINITIGDRVISMRIERQ